MKEFNIYCNYGVLTREKRNVYTYGSQHPTATCSDKMTVQLPENNVFTIYENNIGELIVESSWGWKYDINEVLQGDNQPCFYALDKDGNGHRIYLKEV